MYRDHSPDGVPARHLSQQQATLLQRMLTRRHQMRAAIRDFIDAAADCRCAGVEETTIGETLQRDSRERGEAEGWAVLDRVYALAGARLNDHHAGRPPSAR